MLQIAPLALLAALGIVACGSRQVTAPSRSPTPAGGRADVGGYELAYECRGEGEPTVILEPGSAPPVERSSSVSSTRSPRRRGSAPTTVRAPV